MVNYYLCKFRHWGLELKRKLNSLEDVSSWRNFLLTGCFSDESRLDVVIAFFQMLERKKAEGRKRRRKKDIDLINDNDDAIAKMIADMRLAAREDRDLNIARFVDFSQLNFMGLVGGCIAQK